ncbi:MAG TPA: acyl-CoA dehydrogenase [Casimicrobiaceae bacterium]|jgi:alkylation response protein AidB-like acyl-CoA dehydrogenase|nr:acyl-CoA dehydrogenase [Casimicrobiaceae bacterium]
MNFDYNEEQQLLAASVKRFIDKDYTFEARRKIVASSEGHSDAIWSTFAEIGLLGLPFSPDVGGFGGGAIDLMSVMEAVGEALVVEPYLSTVALSAQFVARAGTNILHQAILPLVCAGKLKMAFAQTETGARYKLAHVATRAKSTSAGYTLSGAKRMVVHAPCADQLIVSARTSGGDTDPQGISVFVVDARASGVSMNAYRTLDDLRAADVVLKDVHVPADALVGQEGYGLALIEEVVDYATALLCAEAVGAIKYANDATLEYLKTRKQFGVPIGSFQALQHRMVDMVISGEQARSMAGLACAKVDSAADPVERKRVVSAAKIKIADACRHVAQEAIQLHGGMGMSDELKISHTFRRLTMIAQQFGDADHHLERFAKAS